MEQRELWRKYTAWPFLIGVPFFLFILWKPLFILDPTNIAWLLTGDPGQHLTGWHQFRMDEWRFPLMEQALAGYPASMSAVFTDSNPLFSLFFKVFRSFLPPHFQFVGLWYLLGLFLNYLVLYRTLRLFSSSRSLCLLGATLISIFPPLFFRDVHDTLTAHFLINLLLYFIFKDEKRYTYPAIAALCALTVSIHFYFLLFALLTTPTKLFYERGFNRGSVSSAFLWLGINIFCALVMMTLLGYWGYKGEVGGFGLFSMNLNALINPLGLSRLLPTLPLGTDGQYEGYQYLGLGWMLFLVWSLLTPRHVLLRRQFWALLLCFFLPLTLLSLSNSVYWGDRLLFKVPLPRVLQYVGDTLRASGRFFWGVGYGLMLLAFKKVFAGQKGGLVAVAVALCLGVQFYDVRLSRYPQDVLFPASRLAAVMERQSGRPTHVNTSLLLYSEYISTPFYVDLLYLADRKIPVTGLYAAREKKDALRLSCKDSLVAGGMCLVPRRNLFALPGEAFVVEIPGYLVASSSPLEGARRAAEIEPAISFTGAELAFSPENVRRQGNSVVSGEQGGIVTFGPYLNVPPGMYLIKVSYSATEGSEVFFDVFSNRHPSLYTQYTPSPSETVFYCRVELEQPVPDLEIRTFINGKGSLAVHGLTIKKES